MKNSNEWKRFNSRQSVRWQHVVSVKKLARPATGKKLTHLNKRSNLDTRLVL